MQPEESEEFGSRRESTRWRLVGDLLAFQFKLALDGLRDVLLSPLSLLAALAGLIFAGKQPGLYFYGLLRLGHRSDQWIRLFSAVADYARGGYSDEAAEYSSDTIVQKVEDLLVDGYRNDGLIARLKQSLDNLWDRFRN